jgi:tetratricopeptide (TPR) repeat protein
VRAPALLTVLALALAAAPARADEPAAAGTSWATTQATELVRQARDHVARGESGTAVARYLEAIKLDPTYAPAYLGLAAQYEARGDVVEAERTYAVALDHVPGFAEALVARGRLRARLRRQEEAIGDLEAAVTITPEALPILRELAAAYVAARALPAALAVTRRIAAVAEAQQDAAAAAEAKLKAKALALLVGEADPVTAGRTGRGPVRNALAGGAPRIPRAQGPWKPPAR